MTLPRRLRRLGARPLLDRWGCPADTLVNALVEQEGLGIAIIDRRGAVVRVNAPLRRMAGPCPALIPGRPIAGLFHPERRAEAWAAIASVLNGASPRGPFTSALRLMADRGGAPPAVTVSLVPLHEAGHRVHGAILQIADTASQRHLEMQLAQSQKMQAIGQLAAGIAHDFNNLLTAILGAADDALGRPVDVLTRADLQQIRASADRGADLVRQLLAFSRQQALQPRTIAVNEAVHRVAALLRRVLGSKIALDLQLGLPDRMVRVDPTQLDQVLVNLAINARHAMPGGGRLTLRTGLNNLDQPLARGTETIPPGPYGVIEVADTGIGIPQDILPRIFDPFFTTRREQGGSGLGLSTVHGIVRQSGGYLDVDSAEGQGARFTIYLPCCAPSAAMPPAAEAGIAAPGPAGAPHPAAPAGRLVLVVDDEAAVLKLAARALTGRGWSVLAAESGEAALELLADNPAQRDGLCAIVSDVVMPGIDGPALVRALRAHRPDLPAILTSGYAEAAVRGGVGTADALVLSKPYTLKVMLDAVERLALPLPALTPCSEM